MSGANLGMLPPHSPPLPPAWLNRLRLGFSLRLIEQFDPVSRAASRPVVENFVSPAASIGIWVAGRVFRPVVALPLLFFPEITQVIHQLLLGLF